MSGFRLRRRAGRRYVGDVCFCSDRQLVPFAGHYAVERGKPNARKPLRWVETSADPDDNAGHWEFV